ncbi:FKBP-type peptidyl-prolyl cis-trans isomerase [Candidatus Woesearchaeota archaeon]|nr:FKBP-type peptidyl-prolyl cis-trans isomerase [Candidatus Woesearchaeota archaeon]
MNKKIIFAICILTFILAITSCSNDNIIEITEDKPNLSEPTESIDASGIQLGDMVEMNFVLYGEDGRVIDTNNKELAQKAGLKTYSLGIYRFIVGQSSKVKGFDTAIIGLEKGDKKTLDIPASTNKIELESDLEQIELRTKTVPRKQTFALKSFEKVFGKPPIIGDVAVNRDMFPWPYKILAITNNSALGEIVIKEGEDAILPGTQWKSKALQVSDIAVQFIQNPKNGQIIETEFGTATIEVIRSRMKTTHNPVMGKEFFYTLPSEQLLSPRYEFRITEITNETFTMNRINFPEQENLKLEVEILDVLSGTEIKKAKLIS